MAGKGPVAATRRWATQYISGPRFEPYLRACGGNHTAAMKLYGWNITMSGALYEGVHVVEVMMRNAIDSQLREWNTHQDDVRCKNHQKQKRKAKNALACRHGGMLLDEYGPGVGASPSGHSTKTPGNQRKKPTKHAGSKSPNHNHSSVPGDSKKGEKWPCCYQPTSDWLQRPSSLLRRLLNHNGAKAEKLATKSLRGTGRNVTHDDVLAHATFATWRFLLPDSDPGRQFLWDDSLSNAFPHLAKTASSPEDITTAVDTVYQARNRIAHLEPFLKPQRIDATFTAIRVVLSAMNPRCEEWFVSRQRITSLVAQRPTSTTRQLSTQFR